MGLGGTVVRENSTKQATLPVWRLYCNDLKYDRNWTSTFESSGLVSDIV